MKIWDIFLANVPFWDEDWRFLARSDSFLMMGLDWPTDARIFHRVHALGILFSSNQHHLRICYIDCIAMKQCCQHTIYHGNCSL